MRVGQHRQRQKFEKLRSGNRKISGLDSILREKDGPLGDLCCCLVWLWRKCSDTKGARDEDCFARLAQRRLKVPRRMPCLAIEPETVLASGIIKERGQDDGNEQMWWIDAIRN